MGSTKKTISPLLQSPKFGDVSCPKCGGTMVGKTSDKCPNCGHVGMSKSSEEEVDITKKVVDDNDLIK